MSNDPNAPQSPDPDYARVPPESSGANYGGEFDNRPLPDRSEAANKKLIAGICGILLGTFGVHKFILNYTTAGAIMLAISIGTIVLGVATCGITMPAAGIMSIIGLIEGILYLTKSDEEFYQTYMVGKREWF